MPAGFNIQVPIPGINAGVRSVLVSLYADSEHRAAEVPIAQACYIEWDAFDKPAQGGNLLLRGRFDNGLTPLVATYGNLTVPEMLAAMFN